MDFGGYDTVFWREDKFYAIIGDGLLVMKPWPPQAWYRANRSSPWIYCRPDLFDMNLQRSRAAVSAVLRSNGLSGVANAFERSGGEALSLPEFSIEALPRDVVHVSEVISLLAHDRFGGLAEIAAKLPRPVIRRSAYYRLLRIAREHADWRRFVLAIPEEVREAIQPFPERHFSLASYCARCPGGLDLLQSTPALALMEANCWIFDRRVQRPLRSCRSLLRKPQRKQLAWLGFEHASNATVRVLRKVIPACLTTRNLRYLREAMNDPHAMKMLCHVPRLHRGVIRIVTDPELRRCVSPAFVNEVGACTREDTEPTSAYCIRDVTFFEPDKSPTFRSRSQLVKCHTELMRERRRLQRLDEERDLVKRKALVFPDPPFPGSDWLIPIRSPVELFDEGDEQRHCVATYDRRIAAGDAYAYRVLTNHDRATLMLERVNGPSGRRWRFGNCLGKRNAPISNVTHALIASWLREQQDRQPVPPWLEKAQASQKRHVRLPAPPEQLELELESAASCAEKNPGLPAFPARRAR